MGIEPSPFMREVDAYSPPPFRGRIDLRLDGNEGRPPPASLLDEIPAAGPEICRSYPSARPLEEALAARLGVGPERVLVTAGGDDAIERAVRAVLAPGREMLLPVPTFEMLERYAGLTGCTVRSVEWTSGGYPVDDVLAAVTGETRMIVVVTPNSPTGLTATAADLARLREAAPQALLLVDLAYIEFADVDLTQAVLELDGAVAIRSMSKAWGLAGLRVGYAAGSAEVLGWMRACGHPYAVSGPSLRLAQGRLETGREDVERFAQRIRFERVELGRRLEAMGAACLPSQANFVLARFDDAMAVREGLAGRGIAVRIFPGKAYLEGCLRITLPGDEDGFGRLARALEEVTS